MSRARRGPSRVRVFLDNNIWNALAVGGVPLTADQLVEGFRAGRVEIVATVELYEELLGTARRKPQKYKEMRRLYRKLGGLRRTLLPIRERHHLEVESGGALTTNTRYLPPAVVRSIVGLATNAAVVHDINDDVYQRKQQSQKRDRTAVDAALGEVKALGKKVSDFDHVVTVDMVRDETIRALAFGAQHGMPTVPAREVEFARVPSLWLISAAVLARATRALGTGRAVRDSDNHDRLHCSAGAYYDVLVTDDEEFRDTLAMIPERPFEVLNTADFAARL